MDSLELLSKQLQQYQDQNQKQLQSYQDQNQREHEVLTGKIDQLLTEINILYSERNLNEDKFNRLQAGQEEIKEELNGVKEDLKVLQEHHLKRDHSFKLAIKIISVTATICAIVGGVLKWIGVF